MTQLGEGRRGGCGCPWVTASARAAVRVIGVSEVRRPWVAVCGSGRLCESFRVRACDCQSDFFVWLPPVVTGCDSGWGLGTGCVAQWCVSG